MQRRYKGIEIPTYDEVIDAMVYKTEDPIAWIVDGKVRVNLFTHEEADEIKENYGTHGLNSRIDDIMVDFIDHAYNASLVAIDSVEQFKTSVENNPLQEFTAVRKFKEINAAQEEVEEDEDSNALTEHQIERIVAKTEEIAANNADVQTIRKINEAPVKEEHGEMKKVMVNVDPNTGEHQIIGQVEEDDDIDNETFEEMCERVMNSDIHYEEDRHINEEDMDIIENNAKSVFSQMVKADDDFQISPSAIKQLIDVANRKIDDEDFSVYNALPEEVKNIINKYAQKSGIPMIDKRYKMLRNNAADALVEDFINNINSDKTKKDFNSEIESIFDKGMDELTNKIVGYSENKLNRYKEYVDGLEDGERKEKLTKVLARIQEAYDLNELKEFAKRCKIKKFELEKPSRVFDDFSNKYKNSKYNCYSIEMARPILYRALNSGATEEYTDRDINAFFIAFCKQTMNMREDNVFDHSYMYYVIYNVVLSDINKGEDTKHISEKFLENVKEVIHNVKERNKEL